MQLRTLHARRALIRAKTERSVRFEPRASRVSPRATTWQDQSCVNTRADYTDFVISHTLHFDTYVPARKKDFTQGYVVRSSPSKIVASAGMRHLRPVLLTSYFADHSNPQICTSDLNNSAICSCQPLILIVFHKLDFYVCHELLYDTSSMNRLTPSGNVMKLWPKDVEDGNKSILPICCI